MWENIRSLVGGGGGSRRGAGYRRIRLKYEAGCGGVFFKNGIGGWGVRWATVATDSDRLTYHSKREVS